MTREPDRFDAQARDIASPYSDVLKSEAKELVRAIAAALRAAEASALERAAQVALDPYGEAVQCYGPDEPFAVGKKIAKAVRALIPPAAAPAAEVPTQDQLRADLERAVPGAEYLAASLRKQFSSEPAAETGKWFWVRAEHPRGAAEEPIYHLSDGGAPMRCGDYVTGRVVRETPRRDRQCMRCRAYELRAAPPEREGT